jgi:hypothetical protein
MDFIFMLTRQDRTIADCLRLYDEIRQVGLKHVGFKDVGVDGDTLARLTERIRRDGAVSYMEVVSTSPEEALRSARTAVQLGVDRLLGGTDVDAVAQISKGSATSYYPFPGFPQGHPTKLAGKPSDITGHCRSFMERGCAGCDILAYRATEADPIDLVKAARLGLGAGYLIVAGSINSLARISDIADAGADAFTIGSAIFDGSYSPHAGSILTQLEAVIDDCEKVGKKG